MPSNFFFPFENRAFYDVMNDRVRQATDDSKIWGMRFAYLITKATDTHSE